MRQGENDSADPDAEADEDIRPTSKARHDVGAMSPSPLSGLRLLPHQPVCYSKPHRGEWWNWHTRKT